MTRNYHYNGRLTFTRLFLAILLVSAPLAAQTVTIDTPPESAASDSKDLISSVKRLERKLGFRRTKNFRTETAESSVAYRCYYTGKFELPESYERLMLVSGTPAGCPLDSQKYDVFFYPLEAMGSGKSPLSTSLANESVERFLVVVPHEDFHSTQELHKLPAAWGEASSTLIGFITAEEVAREKFGDNSDVYRNLQREPELFARKAEIVNRYHTQLRDLYASVRAGQISERYALIEKERVFRQIHQECSAIVPEPKSFNRCLSASNNAGLAFDETYTEYYPMMYQLYLRKGRELKPTLAAIEKALDAPTEAEALVNLQTAAGEVRW